jgi:hypothetical protein
MYLGFVFCHGPRPRGAPRGERRAPPMAIGWLRRGGTRRDRPHMRSRPTPTPWV